MSNPYAAFNISDDEEDNKVTVVKAEDKPKRTHQDKKNFKKQQEEAQKVVAKAPAASIAVEEDGTKERKPYPHMERNKRDWKEKPLTAGHTHDRKSGTGRQDRPRKAGGGYGNVGNVKDEQNQDKYVKENQDGKVEGDVPAQVETPVQVKPASPEKQTLDEYYKSKGVDLTYKVQAKNTKRGDVNAEWIKKEKLTVLESKEDKKNQEKNGEQNVKHTSIKVGLDLDEEKLNVVGFGAKPHHVKHEDHKGAEKRDNKGGKKNKPLFSADDFPSL